jgi:uncharacterized membrane protein
MNRYYHSASTASVVTHAIYAALVSFPFACFTLTLLSDIAYWRTSHLLWQHFSEWLLMAGLVFGAFAVIAAVADLLLGSRYEARRSIWIYAIGSAIVLCLAIVNSLVHAGDGWTSVVPNGLILSAVTVVVMFVTAWFGRSMALRSY